MTVDGTHRMLLAMRRGMWARDLEALRIASWEDVISARHLVELGVPERTVYRRTQQDGPWTLLLPATIMLTKGTPTPRQWEIAALVYAGNGAMLTGLSGMRHHGMRRGGDPIFDHVLITLGRRAQSSGRATIERTVRLPCPVARDGLPVAPLARCVVDHVRRLKDPEAIAAVVTEPVQRRMVTVEALWRELEVGTRKGTAAPRRVLEAARAGVLSPAEFNARSLWESFDDLPPIEWNVDVFDERGRFVATVDGLVREHDFVWEIDSVEQHFATPEQVRATSERQRRLRAVGLHVLSTRPTQGREDPDGVHDDICANLRIAAALPQAPVVYGVGIGRSPQ
ncbi:hypothetical protein [Actinomycetospora lemnae]|uniref:Type IV toxin-antitoxin system AbiEi family antitoxin domain-containing protein n=1 Tax=Actinomycetospora lemnae TaxID=3019891 RepID=A0ABT5SX95_9PSEU|nr:hypothetical protein [Actinomycetospora sp. DW7H6]MDD7967384.1 hypothetical protein [Actinomycetospora sp. DW7H6]